MILLVRDRDRSSVAEAVCAFADEEGLDRIDVGANPLAALGGDHVAVAKGGEYTVVTGLESLDIAEPEEWGSSVSTACEAEAVVLEPADDGVRVHVFDQGEHDAELDIAVDASGKTRAPALAELTSSEDARRALRDGIQANDGTSLLQGILQCLGVVVAPDDVAMLVFRDPLDEEEAEEEAVERELVVGAGFGARIDARVGTAVRAMMPLFDVGLTSGDPVKGVRLELSCAAELLTIERVLVSCPVGDGQGRDELTIDVEDATFGVRLELPDAVLASAEAAAPSFDVTNLFATVQSLMSSTEAQARAAMVIAVEGRAARAGAGTLCLEVAPLDGHLPAARGEVPVTVVA